MNGEERRQLLFLLLIAFVVLAAGLGLRAPWPPDEPRFALIARDMVEHGQWLIPRVGGVLYPDKPPLFFWTVALFYAVTGSIDVALLLPGLLAGLVVTFLVADLGRWLWGAETGTWCAATLLATVQFPLQMRGGQIDALLCLWTTFGLYAFLRHLLLGPDWRWYAAGGAAAGLGIITKGVGFLPYLVFVPMLTAARGGWSYRGAGWRDVRWLLAPLATLLVVAAWLVPMLVVTGIADDPSYAAYRDNILFHQTVTRYADAWGHIKPPWYLLTNAAAWLWLPVTLLLPWLVPAWRRDIAARHLPTLLIGGWLLLVLLFFSLSDGKRAVYIFPAAPAMALLAGRHAKALIGQRVPGVIVRAWPVALALLLVVLGGGLLLDPGQALRWVSTADVAFSAAMAVLLTGIAMLVAASARGRRGSLRGVAAPLVVMWVGLGVFLAPVLDRDRSGRMLMQRVEQLLPAQARLGLIDWPEQFLLQAARPVVHFGFRRDLDEELADGEAWLTRGRERVLLMPDRLAAPCFDPGGVTFVARAHRRTWVLADATALVADCVPATTVPIEVVHYVPTGSAKDLARSAL